MFKKILIANRGEIACRIATTARKLGIQTVAVFSDADARAKHVSLCDQAVHIGPSAARDSYLQWQRIIDAALATGAQAVHPGYGFLSENQSFAQACADQGLVFIGPPPNSIESMGLKAQSKRLMAQAGVPLVPGYHDSDQTPALLQAQADQIGYPVLIKASAGGGGKGMRAVYRSEDFMSALESCKREATSSFGNDAVLIEKYVQRPRHIEIQIFADSHGQCIYLFERDCSVQRRHQKILEEAPAPGLSPQLRQQMGQAAVAAAQAVGYVGAGTVEFIVEQPQGYDRPEMMQFYFMEMNTRLQVEHPVTEAITAIDLVQWQLLIAAGEPLPLTQDQVTMHGHAIEARICAENPQKKFMPVTGTLQTYRKPMHSAFCVSQYHDASRGVRFDDGVRAGDTISPFYDSMIAKVIVHGATREQALAKLDQTLGQTHIVGLTTNTQFLRDLLKTDAFANAKLDTALIEREREALFEGNGLQTSWALAAAVAYALEQEKALVTNDPFSQRDSWRLLNAAPRQFLIEHDGKPALATLTREDGTNMRLTVGMHSEPFSYHCENHTDYELLWGQERLGLSIYAQSNRLHLFTPNDSDQVLIQDELDQATQAIEPDGNLAAPMPGTVVSYLVQAGDHVRKGQALAVIEAMKMEHTISAPHDGVVQALLFAAGDQLDEGAALLSLQTPPAQK